MEEIENNPSEKDTIASDNQKYYPIPKLNPEIQMPAKIQMSLENDIYSGMTQPYKLPKPVTIPTARENFSHWFSQGNDFAAINRGIESDKYLGNPLNDDTTENYSASDDEDNFTGLDKRYWNYVLPARSDLDAKRRKVLALEKQETDEYFANGGLLSALAGTFAGAAFSPTSWIPVIGAVSKAGFAEHLIANTARMAPSIAVSAAAHNATIQANELGGNLEDFLMDTFRDTAAGVVFMGGITGLGKGVSAYKLYDARKAISLHYEGIEPVAQIDADGNITRIVATPARNEAISAKRLEFAQEFLDSQMAMNGMFKVPVLGNLLGKGAAKVNPIIRGLNSRFPSVRAYTDRIASHSIKTEGIEAGKPKPLDYDTLLYKQEADNKLVTDEFNALHMERNGIDPSSKTADIKKLKMKWQKEGYVTPEQFGAEISQVRDSGIPSDNAVVNKAAARYGEELDKAYAARREAYNLSPEFSPPPTAKGYTPRVHNQNEMVERPEDWIKMSVESYTQSDEIIRSHMEPIDNFKSDLEKAIADHEKFIRGKKATDPLVKKSSDNIAKMKKKLTRMQDDLTEVLRDNTELHMHVEDRYAITASEAKQIKTYQKPLKEKQKLVDKQKKVVADLKRELELSKRSAIAGKTKKTAKKYTENVDSVKKLIQKEEEALFKLTNDLQEEELKLQDDMRSGEIPRHLFEEIPDSQELRFKDVNNKIKFREVFTSKEAMEQEAKAVYDTILNQSPEDTMEQVLRSSPIQQGENHIKRRTHMISDEHLRKYNFLLNNHPVILANYKNMMYRKVFMKEVFGDVSLDGGIEPIILGLQREFEDMRADIIKTFKDGEGKKKALALLKRDFDDAKEFMKLSYDRMMGKTRGSKKARQFSNTVRSFAAMTKLGGTVLTMSTDATAIVFKHGFWPTINHGLMPMLKNIAGGLKSRNSKAYRDSAAHAHMAISTLANGYSDRNWGGVGYHYEPIQNVIGAGIQKMAHVSGNLYGTNQVENFLQRMTANIIQSKIMSHMLDYKAGKLSAKNKEALLMYGLDPEEWADKFIAAWKSRGSDGNGAGGYMARYWEWADHEAANKMSTAITMGTRDTIIRRGLMDSPFFHDDPIFSALFTFAGWTHASITRYLVPLMQNPDADKLVGTMLMLMAGATVTPLRRAVRGEDPIQDDDSMFYNALVDSGVFSSIMSTVNTADILAQGAFLKRLGINENDRYRNRTVMGALGGPVGSILDEASHTFGMIASGNYNQNDLNKMARLIPYTQAFYLRALTNKMIESTGLPKTAAQASRQ